MLHTFRISIKWEAINKKKGSWYTNVRKNEHFKQSKKKQLDWDESAEGFWTLKGIWIVEKTFWPHIKLYVDECSYLAQFSIKVSRILFTEKSFVSIIRSAKQKHSDKEPLKVESMKKNQHKKQSKPNTRRTTSKAISLHTYGLLHILNYFL